MINVTFIGNIFLSDDSPATDVKCQGLFIKVNQNSSDTIWDSPRISETNQYNFNLGDNTWLSQQSGYAQPFDKVVLCFWVDNTEDRDSLNLTEWAFIEWELDDRDVYVQDVQLQAGSTPTCSFALSGNNPVYVHDTGSNSDNQWVYDSKDHFQVYIYEEEHQIFLINKLEDDVLIEWGDTLFDTYELSASPFDHHYTSPDDYTVTMYLSGSNGLSCQEAINHRVEYEVVNGLTWPEPVRLNQYVVYTPDIAGDLVSIAGVDYYIDSNLTHQNLTYNQTFNHTFIGAGNHQIKQCIKYNDGFDNQIQCEDFIVQLDTIALFVDSDYDCGLVFTDTSEVGAPPIVKYQWDVTDGVFVLAHVEGAAYDSWYYAWPYRGVFKVRLAVTDSNGTLSSYTKEYEVLECPGGTTSSGGGDGGGSSPWVYAETKYINTNDPLPVVHIIKIDDKDEEEEEKRILILEITDDGSIL